MSEVIAKGDFVEVEFVGRLKETGEVVDTNKEAIAKEHDFHNPKSRYEPVIAMIGAQQLMPGIDEGLVGKDLGTYTFELSPEKAFGRKNPKFIQLIATQKFLKEKIEPYHGLQVDVDGSVGTVRSVTGGRTIVDFNHPLSGKDVVYDVTVLKIIRDEKEKLEVVIQKHLGMDTASIEMVNHEAKVTVDKDLPPELGAALGQQIGRMIPSLKKIDFVHKDTKNDSVEDKKKIE
jgi:FKBP-type peptidyl-prolyl cis-trans isomerase 2